MLEQESSVCRKAVWQTSSVVTLPKPCSRKQADAAAVSKRCPKRSHLLSQLHTVWTRGHFLPRHRVIRPQFSKICPLNSRCHSLRAPAEYPCASRTHRHLTEPHTISSNFCESTPALMSSRPGKAHSHDSLLLVHYRPSSSLFTSRKRRCLPHVQQTHTSLRGDLAKKTWRSNCPRIKAT